MVDSVAAALRSGASVLQGASDTARLDAELLMAHALGVSRSEMLLRHMTRGVPFGFAPLLARRLRHEPIAYILGEQDFRGLTFKVTPAVLIPRGDSEVLVEAALQARPDALRVLDCGTGSGALLLATLAELPRATGVGIDRSEGALAVARENAERLALGGRTKLVAADWTSPEWTQALEPSFDLILANPPYVEDDAVLASSVREHEPAGALFAGKDGLADHRVLIPRLPELLADDGVAVVEIGATQAAAVSQIAKAAGLIPNVHRDLGGRARVVEMRR